MKIFPVILAGGVGSRLWPVSRAYFPKQFHNLLSDKSLLQETLLRGAAVSEVAPIIVANEEHRFLVAEQCARLGIVWSRLILEPEGRSSAPGLAAAAYAALALDPDAILMMLASDHMIDDTEVFAEDAQQAAQLARDGFLVTFGIQPTGPETGYGYIETDGTRGAQAVVSFTEKPARDTAQGYVDSGRYLWNSGMFVMSARVYIEELEKFEPDIAAAVASGMEDAEADMDFLRPSAAFLQSPSISVDYAVMERTERAMVLPVSFGWSDVGSWAALHDISPKDADGNLLRGDVLALDTKDSVVLAKHRLVGVTGLDNAVVVETADAVLVAAADRLDGIRDLVQRIGAAQRDEHLVHREVRRPWGSYEGIGDGDRYQVKCISVLPGASLSLQMHHHRSEHWIVVRGAARITCGEKVFTLGENESTYIPRGTKHRLENPGKIVLKLIEVQVGSYLGEDDIERFDDIYGRQDKI
ncbi:MAG: mannose-1-phosphate guanylyltransferase/mannose-6-phosphate isomerase [Pseudomonadota bacterium]